MNFSDLHLDVAPLCRRHRVQSLAVFGSFARGDARVDSDLDMLVEFAGDDHLFDRFTGLQSDLESVAGRRVDLLTAQSLRNPVFRRVVAREQLPVWTNAA
jgi:predicted nucleotidyltransferase